MAGDTATVRTFELTRDALFQDGTHCSIRWKGSVFEETRHVLWHLVDIVDTLKSPFVQRVCLHKYLGTNKDELNTLSEQFGHSHFIPLQVIPNYTMMKYHGEGAYPPEVKQFIRQEVGASTAAIVLILLWHCESSHKLTERYHARRCLDTLLGALLGDDFSLGTAAEAALREVHVACSAPPIDNGQCVHLAEFCQSWRSAGADFGSGWAPASATLRAVMKASMREDCRAVRGLLKRMLQHLSASAEAPVLAGAHDIDAMGLARRRRKRGCRIDEDFKKFVARSAIESRLSKNSEGMLRAHAGDPSLGRKWELKEMMTCSAAAKRAFATCREQRCVVGVVSDGARLGDPPEETVAYILWSPQLDAGIIGVPQVLSFRQRGLLVIPHFRP